MGVAASKLNTTASLSGTMGSFQRRKEDWKHQADLAAKETKQIEKQIAAAEIRVAIFESELQNHDLQIENAKEVDEFMRDKYTNKEPPKYIRGWQTFDDDRLPDDGKGLRGLAASSGTVTGRARVCRKLEEISKIEKGDILVTVATDPAWTTVFSIIGGVVVETGGVVAHTVMISREYGLPCVANLSQACDLIPDGATITVDGSNGRVVIHDGV